MFIIHFYILGALCEEDIDECEIQPGPCRNGATCLNQDGGFRCICVNGWEDPLCTTNVDDCAPRSCYNGGTCIDYVGYFRCQCTPGRLGKPGWYVLGFTNNNHNNNNNNSYNIQYLYSALNDTI